MLTGHMLDLNCIRLLNAAPICGNYAKLYFDIKHLEKGSYRGVKFFILFFQKKKVPFFHRKVHSQANTKHCPKFLEYAVA